MCLMRIAGAGRFCELLRDGEDWLEVDRYLRRFGLAHDARRHICELAPGCQASIEAYCRGVNAAWDQRIPWAMHLAGYRPEPFSPADCLTVMKLMAFVGLTEGQRTLELFIVEAVRRGASAEELRELIPHLNSLDAQLVCGLAGVPPVFPGAQSFPGVPSGSGSNNWAVSGRLTASGAPMLCGDPHLEVNRLPAVLYEAHIEAGEEWAHGGSIPGLPGFLTGRNGRLAWSATYSFADAADFFVERCRDGRYLHAAEWRPFRTRIERILRKRHEPAELVIHENEHGILEGDPTRPGDYLCWSWCGSGPGGLGSLKALLDLMRCRSVTEGQTAVRAADVPSLHTVFADAAGDIGYQMIGCIPRRRQGWSGLAPVAGWLPENNWNGHLDPATELPSEINPPQGFIVTANEARQCPDGPVLSPVGQPLYRRRRIEAGLASRNGFTIADMQALQYDVLSLQAERLLPVLLPHVPPGPEREMLARWDLRYGPESIAAALFDNLYREVTLELLGERLGREWIAWLQEQTHLPVLIFGLVDDLLCREDSSWLPAAQRTERLAKAVRAGLAAPVVPWGERNAIRFSNLFLGGRLPGFLSDFLGADPGPYPLRGCRATVHQGTRLRHGGRDKTLAPCYHFVTDLSAAESWTNLPGGSGELPLSRRYTGDLVRWLRGTYKQLA